MDLSIGFEHPSLGETGSIQANSRNEVLLPLRRLELARSSSYFDRASGIPRDPVNSLPPNVFRGLRLPHSPATPQLEVVLEVLELEE